MITEQNFNKLIQDIINPETRDQAAQEYSKRKLEMVEYVLEHCNRQKVPLAEILELPNEQEMNPNDQITILHNGLQKVVTYVGLKYQPKTDTMGHAVYMDEQPYWVSNFIGADLNGNERILLKHRDSGVLEEVSL